MGVKKQPAPDGIGCFLLYAAHFMIMFTVRQHIRLLTGLHIYQDAAV